MAAASLRRKSSVAFGGAGALSGVVLAVWSPKGGSGTSVVAAALALTLARRGGCRLVDFDGDQPALLGLTSEPGAGVAEWLATGPEAPATALDRLTVEAAPGLALLPRGGPLPPEVDGAGRALALALGGGAPAVVDVGTAGHAALRELAEVADGLVMVLRPCYLALRRALGHPLLATTTGAVVVEEPGRSLRAGDVAQVLERPVLAAVRAEARVARAVDAGLLASRLPAPLARMAAGVVDVVAVRDAS